MKIPTEAKRVFTGVIFDVYQWEQKLFDGSTAMFEALKRPDTVQIIPIQGDKILLSSEVQPQYDLRRLQLLGGRAESGEEPLGAAKREFLEETGLAAESWELFKAQPVGGKIDWTIHYYIARNCEKVGEPHLDPGERIDVKAVSFEEFIGVVLSESFDNTWLANMFFRMKEANELGEFKKKLFKTNG